MPAYCQSNKQAEHSVQTAVFRTILLTLPAISRHNLSLCLRPKIGQSLLEDSMGSLSWQMVLIPKAKTRQVADEKEEGGGDGTSFASPPTTLLGVTD